MSGISDAHHFRKMVAGFCMLMAPVLVLAGEIIRPELHRDAADQFGAVAANMDSWAAAHVLLFAGVVLAVPAALGLMHMLRERQVALGHVGGAMLVAGLMAVAGITGMNMVVWQMAEGSRAEMVALLERVTDETAIVIPFFVMSLFTGIGLMVMAWGLHKARAVHAWAAACLALAGAGFVVEAVAFSSLAGVIAAALLTAGLGSIGWMVWRESDEAWEHPPTMSAA